MRVRDADVVLQALKKAGAPVPLGPSGKTRSLIARDPDGYMVEALQVSPPENAVAGNVIGGMMSLTVSDMEATLRFYHDLLGFDLKGKMEFVKDQALAAAGGIDGGEFRQMSANVPGTNARMLFWETKGVPRTPFHLRVPDPGCPAVALRVNDLDGLLKRMKAVGVKVVSAGGEPQQFTPTIRNIFVEDPDGFHIELYQVYR